MYTIDVMITDFRHIHYGHLKRNVAMWLTATSQTRQVVMWRETELVTPPFQSLAAHYHQLPQVDTTGLCRDITLPDLY
jgi:hypothetical protein